MSVSVLVVDDHAVFARGLTLVLEAAGDLTVVGTAGTVADAVRLAAASCPDVVLLDLRLPDGLGTDAATRILQVHPGVSVVMLSAETGDDTLMTAVEAGASGYLVKSRAAEHVIDAVRRAAAGEMLFEPATLASVIARQRARARAEREAERSRVVLTPRETEVLRLMAEGLDNKSIADRLGIGLNTVRGHVQTVLEKLDAHSKLEAVVKAGQRGLL